MELKRKPDIKEVRIVHNKFLFWIIILLVILLIGIQVYRANLDNKKSGDEQNLINISCETDADCVKQQTSCCSCNMGGSEQCMNKDNSDYLKTKLSNECKERTICTALYACKETSCKCINKKCIEQ